MVDFDKVRDAATMYIDSIYPKDRRGKGIVCPICGNGTGKDGDGVTFVKAGNPVLKCFRCGFSGDVIKLTSKARNITYREAAVILAEQLGMSEKDFRKDGKFDRPIQAFDVSKVKHLEENKSEEEKVSQVEYFKQMEKHLTDTTYPQERGLSLETCRHYHLVFDKIWRHPKIKNGPVSPRLIIPTSEYSYLARDVRSNLTPDQKRYSKQKFGSVPIFNAAALEKEFVFITEGELDAISFYEVCKAEAVALGSVSNIQKLVDYLKNMPDEKRPKYLIAALDDDEAGDKGNSQLKEALKEIGINVLIAYGIYYDCTNKTSYKDANEFLVKNRDAFIENIEFIRTIPYEIYEKDEESQMNYIMQASDEFFGEDEPEEEQQKYDFSPVRPDELDSGYDYEEIESKIAVEEKIKPEFDAHDIQSMFEEVSLTSEEAEQMADTENLQPVPKDVLERVKQINPLLASLVPPATYEDLVIKMRQSLKIILEPEKYTLQTFFSSIEVIEALMYCSTCPDTMPAYTDAVNNFWKSLTGEENRDSKPRIAYQRLYIAGMEVVHFSRTNSMLFSWLDRYVKEFKGLTVKDFFPEYSPETTPSPASETAPQPEIDNSFWGSKFFNPNKLVERFNSITKIDRNSLLNLDVLVAVAFCKYYSERIDNPPRQASITAECEDFWEKCKSAEKETHFNLTLIELYISKGVDYLNESYSEKLDEVDVYENLTKSMKDVMSSEDREALYKQYQAKKNDVNASEGEAQLTSNTPSENDDPKPSANLELENASEEEAQLTSNTPSENDEPKPSANLELEKSKNLLNSITEFTEEKVLEDEILQAAAYCKAYAPVELSKFLQRCRENKVKITLLRECIRQYARPVLKEKRREDKQREREKFAKEAQIKREAFYVARLNNARRISQLLNDPQSDERDQKIIDLIKKSLERDYKGNVKSSSVTNFELVLHFDPIVRGCIGYDAFSQRIVPRRKLPWTDELACQNVWANYDDAGLQNYLNRVYELNNDRIFFNVISEYAHKNSFHPIRDYFNNLPQWDGTKRAAEFFIENLEIEDNNYSREVIKSWMLAAISRAFHPGCKWDYTLVIKGAQGIGKSTVFSKLAGKWFNDSIENIGGKETLENLLGSWIIELCEMQATKKADNEIIKAFISRQADKFRVPYGRRTEEFLRQCVFAATTNDEEFLKDQTGNRRFFVLVAKAKDEACRERFARFNAAHIDQIWAEVFHYYNELFDNDRAFDSSKLLPSDEIMKQAAEIRMDYTEGSGLAGMLGAYLNTKIPEPEIWNDYNLAQRRKYIQSYSLKKDGTLDEQPEIDPEHTVLRTTVSAVEIAYELLRIDNPSKERATLSEINKIMSNMKGWHRTTWKRLGVYGQQRIAFERDVVSVA